MSDIESMYRRALQSIEEQRFDRAVEELEWLWLRIPAEGPTWLSVRSTFVVCAMGEVARESVAARDRWLALLRDMRRSLAATSPVSSFADWIRLSLALGESESVQAWLREADKSVDPIASALVQCERVLFDMFVGEQQYAEAGRVIADPLESLRGRLEAEAAVLAKRRCLDDSFPQWVECVERCLSEAGREADRLRFMQAYRLHVRNE